MAAIFLETADNEKEHAKVFFQHLAALAPSALEITASYPVVAGRRPPRKSRRPLKARTRSGRSSTRNSPGSPRRRVSRKSPGVHADRQGREEHEARYRRLLRHVVNGTVFQRGEKIYWRCRNCGYIHEGDEAPDLCPACQHPQAYFEPVGEKY